MFKTKTNDDNIIIQTYI